MDRDVYVDEPSCDNQTVASGQISAFRHIRVKYFDPERVIERGQPFAEWPNRIMLSNLSQPATRESSRQPSSWQGACGHDSRSIKSPARPIIEDSLRIVCSAEEHCGLEQLQIDSSEICEKAMELVACVHAKWRADIFDKYRPGPVPDSEILQMESDARDLRARYEDALFVLALTAKAQEVQEGIRQLDEEFKESTSTDGLYKLLPNKDLNPYCAN
ncbi:uncharacterized protein LOC111268139 [Varroa jacobsoni]|uniref:Uncharacterized protein n=1 Tax=Varroa destructor TaxID=109461 RepID=A0A7M7KT10_VARDE|nr:uncharacterized protein LOC111254707 [Varroa destructor]XP_022702638.1 uncharacterized protein LOC111268139 [Varroa jacobsoni]